MFPFFLNSINIWVTFIREFPVFVIHFLRISTLSQHFHVTGLKVVIKYSIKILPNVHIVMFKLNYNTEKGAPTTGWHLPCQL